MVSPVNKIELPKSDQLLPGRSEEMLVPDRHYVLGAPLSPPFPDRLEYAMFGMGCFWGAELKFWEAIGVFTTSVGYAAGGTPNPTYQEVCTGLTGHNEVVRVLFDPSLTSYSQMLKIFWESHNPTEYMRQGNDLGTQYRSELYYFNRSNKNEALASLDSYQSRLNQSGFWQDSNRNLARSTLLLCRDLPSTISRKKPQWLLWSWGYWSELYQDLARHPPFLSCVCWKFEIVERVMRKTALVTGASSGIGLELARVFAERENDLVLVARNKKKLVEIADDLEFRYPVKVYAIPLDLNAKRCASSTV